MVTMKCISGVHEFVLGDRALLSILLSRSAAPLYVIVCHAMRFGAGNRNIATDRM